MKKVLILFFVMVLGITLTACTGSSNKTEKDLLNYDIITELPDDEVTITFWHSFGTNKENLIKGYIADFNEVYPNIKVEFTKEGSNYNELRDKVVSNIVTGTTPTMVFTYPDHVADYIEGKAILSLDPFVEDETVGYTQAELDDFVPVYLEENHQTGHYYGLPFNKSTEVLIYNKTYFEDHKDEAGFTKLKEMYDIMNPETGTQTDIVTWDLVKEVSQEIKDHENNEDIWGFAYDSLANLFITTVRQWGGEYTNSDGDILFNNDTTKAALAYYKDLHDNGLATIPAEWEEDYASTPFTKKEVMMTVGSTAGITYNVPDLLPEPDGDNIPDWEIGVAPIPQKDEDSKAAIQQGTNISIMANSTDEQRLAAWLLIKYLASKDVTVDWAMNTGYLPVSQSGLESDTYQSFLANPEADLFAESLAANAAYLQVDYLFYDPAFPGSSNVRANAETAMKAILFNQEGKTIDMILQEAYNDLNW